MKLQSHSLAAHMVCGPPGALGLRVPVRQPGFAAAAIALRPAIKAAPGAPQVSCCCEPAVSDRVQQQERT